MRKKNKDPEELAQLIKDFEAIVRPWCEEEELSLHQAFELSRESDPEKYKILSGLWSTIPGTYYLKSVFSSHGGVLRKREGNL